MPPVWTWERGKCIRRGGVIGTPWNHFGLVLCPISVEPSTPTEPVGLALEQHLNAGADEGEKNPRNDRADDDEDD